MKITNFDYWELSRFNRWIANTDIFKKICSDRSNLMVNMHMINRDASVLKDCILEYDWLDNVDEDTKNAY